MLVQTLSTSDPHKKRSENITTGAPIKDRRRDTLSFLTWAFFLSEAFKGIPTASAGHAMSADFEEQMRAGHGETPALQSLADSEGGYSAWSVDAGPEPNLIILTGNDTLVSPDLAVGSFDSLGAIAGGQIDGIAFAFGDASGGAGAAPTPLQDIDLPDTPEISVALDLPLLGSGLDVSLDLGPGLGLGLDLGLDLNLGLGSGLGVNLDLNLGATVGNLLGGPVLVLDQVLEMPLQAVSDLTTGVTSLVTNLTSDLLGGALGSSGVLNVVGDTVGGAVNELFSGGTHTDYHVALQIGDVPGALSLPVVDGVVDGVADAVADVAGAAAGLVPAITGSGPSHDTLLPLPSAIEELVIRGSIDIVL